MVTSNELTLFMYTEVNLYRYLKTLPLWRRILLKFFERYRISKEEYDKWFMNDMEDRIKIIKK